MSQGWMRVREAAHLMGVSQSTVRRRVDGGDLRGRTGKSGRQEVFLPAKLRRELEARQTSPNTPGHMERGKTPDEVDAIAKEKKTAKAKAQHPSTTTKPDAQPKAAADTRKKTQASPNTPAPESGTDTGDNDDLLKRYERLAGGSLILAQQHSDAVSKQSSAAYEQLAHTRNQVRHLRKLALAGWGSCAAVLVLMLVLTVTLGMGKARAEATASVNQQHAQQAEQRARTMSGMLLETRAQDETQAADQAPQPTPAPGTAPGRRLHGPTVSVPTR